MTLVIDPKVALLKGVDPVQFCVFNETAAGQWPEEAMDMLCRLAREGLRERETLASAVCDGRPLDH